MKTILCYGDSNTHGAVSVNGERFKWEERWPNILGKLLGNGYDVKESGVDGRTTAYTDPVGGEELNGLSHLSAAMLTHAPLDLLILMLGTNDTKEYFHLSVAQIAQGMEKLIVKAQSMDCWRNAVPEILVIAPAPILPGYETKDSFYYLGNGCAEKSAALAPVYERLSRLKKCEFFDASSIAEINSEDHIHLTREGHQALARSVAEIIRPKDQEPS